MYTEKAIYYFTQLNYYITFLTFFIPFSQFFGFGRWMLSLISAFSAIAFYAPYIALTYFCTTRTSIISLIIPQVILLVGFFMTLYPSSSAVCPEGTIKSDDFLWIIRYLTGFYLIIIGQGLFGYFSSMLFKYIVFSLLKAEYSAATAARLSDPFYPFLFLRVLPVFGLGIGAYMGSAYGLEYFGCSFFSLFITLPMGLSLVISCVCIPFLFLQNSSHEDHDSLVSEKMKEEQRGDMDVRVGVEAILCEENTQSQFSASNRFDVKIGSDESVRSFGREESDSRISEWEDHQGKNDVNESKGRGSERLMTW
jgi:hypothetical protein